MSNRFLHPSEDRRLLVRHWTDSLWRTCSLRQLAAKRLSFALILLALYLPAHPLQGTALGLHEYDGKITDYSRLALDAELSRLRRFDDRLAKFDPTKLSARQSIDLRILEAAVKRGLFQMQEMSVFERNPMVYARAADVNVYIKRNFAPLEDRVRSLVAIESQ